MKVARPAYADHIPSPKTLGGSLLNNTYEKYFDIGRNMVRDSIMYSIVTDGWSNITNEHLVNFVLLIPNKPPFFGNLSLHPRLKLLKPYLQISSL